MKKRLIAMMVCGLTAASMLTACGKNIEVEPTDGSSNTSVSDGGEEIQAPKENVELANFTAPNEGDTIIEMNIKGYGTVKLRLFPEYAETGVENFVKLAESGYYDGLKFHRIIKDFMIQGGDPNGDGTGGASIWGGSFDPGTDPHLAHVTGALAYANSGSPDNVSSPTSTSGSQFYIVTGDQSITDDDFALYESYGYTFTENQKKVYKEQGGAPFLDGNYSIFGQVIDGLDIIFKIQYVATGALDDPIEDVIIESVKVSKYNGEALKFYLSDYSYDDPAAVEPINFTAPKEGDEIVVMDIKDYGTVKFRLFPDVLPTACENFLTHAKDGYYDGLTFHRIIKDFMIQGGDPLGTGTGGESIWGDKFDGGKYFNLIHAAGALCYANSGGTDTDGSQFYIVTGEKYDDETIGQMEQSGYSFRDNVKKIYKEVGGSPWLDGSYTVFGQVIDGLDIIFEIQNVDTDAESSKPLKDVVIDKVTVEEYDGSDIKWYISDYNGSEKSEDCTATDTEEATESETAEAATEEATEETTSADAE